MLVNLFYENLKTGALLLTEVYWLAGNQIQNFNVLIIYLFFNENLRNQKLIHSHQMLKSMKSLIGQKCVASFSLKARKQVLPILILGLLFVSIFTNKVLAQSFGVNINLNIPTWAPQYDNVNQVQYYYLPDIESYYDVYNREFVCFENGNWIFAPQLPQRYAWYDFNNSFSVVLDYSAREPWRYHNFYVEHYPRNYYRAMYRNEFENREHCARGFNENNRGLVYRNVDARHDFIERREINERREAAQRHEFAERREASQRYENNERREAAQRHENNERREAAQNRQGGNNQPRFAQNYMPQHVDHDSRNIGQPVKIDYKNNRLQETHSGRDRR